MSILRTPLFLNFVFLFLAISFCKTTQKSSQQNPDDSALSSEKSPSTNQSNTTSQAPTVEPVVVEAEETSDINYKPCQKPMYNMECIKGGEVSIQEKKGDDLIKGKAMVDTFYLDKYEITNNDYTLCSRKGKCDKISNKVSSTLKGAKQPAILSWNMAFQYCRWQGKRLPTEVEWEKAATTDEDAVYPWGDSEASCEKSNYRSCAAKTLPVGSKPANENKIFDLSGNASEWVNDWSSKCRLASCNQSCGAACSGFNPTGPCSGKFTCNSRQNKIIKGFQGSKTFY